jgi:hypothetical protein
LVQGVAGQLIRCYRGPPEGASIAWLGPSRVDGANSRRADSSCSQGTQTSLDLNFSFKFSALRTLAYVQVYTISCIVSSASRLVQPVSSPRRKSNPAGNSQTTRFWSLWRNQSLRLLLLDLHLINGARLCMKLGYGFRKLVLKLAQSSQ